MTKLSLLSRIALVKQHTGGLRQQIDRAVLEGTTGLKLHMPSDDASVWSEVYGLRADAKDQGVYKDNTGKATLMLDTADQALGTVADAIKRARELAVRMSTGTMTADERGPAAAEIDAIRDRVIEAANTSVAGRYVFAGRAYDGAAFDAAGTYLGETIAPEIQISRDQSVVSGFDGSDVFQGVNDTFQVLDDIAVALRNDDGPATAALLDDLDASFDHLVASREKVGYAQQTAQAAHDTAARLGEVMGTRLEGLVSADPVETFSRLANLKTAYESALQASSQAMGQKLFDYLR